MNAADMDAETGEAAEQDSGVAVPAADRSGRHAAPASGQAAAGHRQRTAPPRHQREEEEAVAGRVGHRGRDLRARP